MFVQAVVSSFVSTPSNIDRALLLSVTTIATNQLRSLANIRRFLKSLETEMQTYFIQ